MRDRHVEREGAKLHFQFRGKSGKVHTLDLRNKRLAAIVKRCRDLPGYELFQYIDDDGAHVGLDSGMVNRYLRETTGEDITAKDFRTWHGTVHAAEQLSTCGASTTEREAKHNVAAAIQAVAERLGNSSRNMSKVLCASSRIGAVFCRGVDTTHECSTARGNLKGLAPSERCVLKILPTASQLLE